MPERHRNSKIKKFYADAQIFAANEKVTTEDGRLLRAASLPGDKSTFTLISAANQVFGTSFTASFTSSFYKTAAEIIRDYNQTAETDTPIKPLIIKSGCLHLLFPSSQKEALLKLLEQNKEKLDPLLPFRVSTAEMIQLRDRDPAIIHIIRQRLHYLGVDYLTARSDVTPAEAEKLISPVLDHPSVWKTLSESDPPVDYTSGFQKMFYTSLYRRVINYHRDQQRHGERQLKTQQPFWLLDGSPLQQFFQDNPPGTEAAEELLNTLGEKQRAAFIKRFLEGRPTTPQGDQTKTRPSSKINRIQPKVPYIHIRAKINLEETLNKPKDVWPKPAIIEASRMIAQNYPEFCQAFLDSLSSHRQRWQTYAQLYFQNHMRNPDIAASLGLSLEATKVLGFRVSSALVQRALREGLLLSSQVNLGKAYYSTSKIKPPKIYLKN